MRAWIDQDLCTGDGLCTDHCPEVFILLDDGISYVHDGNEIGNEPGGAASTVHVPRHLERAAVNAALDCPGECIFLEPEPVAREVDDIIDAAVDAA
ncbi:MAG: ferredoxin [Acidimicrobiia bacterium]